VDPLVPNKPQIVTVDPKVPQPKEEEKRVDPVPPLPVQPQSIGNPEPPHKPQPTELPKPITINNTILHKPMPAPKITPF
jgi:hypothetical protein